MADEGETKPRADFKALIEKADIPSPAEVYPALNDVTKVKKITINQNDKANFLKAYKLKPGKSGYGFGEVAIFWLYSTGGTNNGPRAILNVDKNFLADLQINGTPVEAKAYKNSLEKSKVEFGKWTKLDGGYFLELVTELFGVYNIISGKSPVTTNNFDHKDLEDAAEGLCGIRQTFFDLKEKATKPGAKEGDKIALKTITSFPFFVNVQKKIQKIDKMFDSKKGLEDCAVGKEDKDRPGGKKMADKIVLYFLKQMFLRKTGKNGFLINIQGSGGNYTGGDKFEVVKIDTNNIKEDKLAEAVSFNGFRVNINFKLLFG